jgi:hypothetical protein
MSGEIEAAQRLVHEGWQFLRSERPLAARASWERAVGLDPGSKTASDALARLAAAENLPAAARMRRSLESPRDEGAREAWGRMFAAVDSSALDAVAEAFEELVDLDQNDCSAWYNLALCQAWRGLNGSAIEALDHVVGLAAAERFEFAAEAWVLAEVLRPGAVDDGFADDFRDELELEWSRDALGDPMDAMSDAGKHVHRLGQNPLNPTLVVAAWLDRPIPEVTGPIDAAEIPLVRAHITFDAESDFETLAVTIHSARPGALALIERELFDAFGNDPSRLRLVYRRTLPLPLALLDVGAFAFQLPDGLDAEGRASLSAQMLGRFYEHDPAWLEYPRQSLAFEDDDAGSPLGTAARLAALATGSAERNALRAKLEGVIRLREQLAARAPVARFSRYRFDRARRRLGLDPHDPRELD